jgi:protein arginine kinase
MSSEETLFLLSQLRMGVHMGLIKEMEIDMINEMFLTSQPAHLQLIAGGRLDDEERSRLRAERIRRRLTNHHEN